MTCGISIPVPNEGKIVFAIGSRVLSGMLIKPDMEKFFEFTEMEGMFSGIVDTVCYIDYYFGDIEEGDPLWLAAEMKDLRLDEETEGVEFLAIYKQEQWYLTTNGLCVKVEGFQAIGDGSDFALGYLGSKKTPKTVQEARNLALKALEYVCSRTVSESKPFNIKVFDYNGK